MKRLLSLVFIIKILSTYAFAEDHFVHHPFEHGKTAKLSQSENGSWTLELSDSTSITVTDVNFCECENDTIVTLNFDNNGTNGALVMPVVDQNGINCQDCTFKIFNCPAFLQIQSN